RADRPARAWRDPARRRRARRIAFDHGLPWRGAGQPAPDPSGNECAAAGNGNHRTLGPMQPRPADLGAFFPGRNRSLVHEGTLKMRKFASVALAALLLLPLAACDRDG